MVLNLDSNVVRSCGLGLKVSEERGIAKSWVPVTRGRYSQKHFALLHLEKSPYKYLGELGWCL